MPLDMLHALSRARNRLVPIMHSFLPPGGLLRLASRFRFGESVEAFAK